jgi:hypothetical protein
MVFAVQCPNPQCRKFQLVEERDRGKAVQCLICKTTIRVAGSPPPTGNAKSATQPKSTGD